MLLPRATTHRWVPTGGRAAAALRDRGQLAHRPAQALPVRYGQLLEHAPYCERDLHGPAEPLLVEGTDVEVLVKHRGSPAGSPAPGTSYPTHPFDVVGWDGCLYPYTFNVADFEPITGRVHQPPPVHQVFEGTNFVICNFVPRKVDYHPLAIPVPYYHSNVDSDEVMFYCGGDYEARKGSGIGQGSISLHPGGHSHGPQPGAVERSIGVEYFDELAVMVDTFRPAGARRGRPRLRGRRATPGPGRAGAAGAVMARAAARLPVRARQNLPYGVFSPRGTARRGSACAVGDQVLDLAAAAATTPVFAAPLAEPLLTRCWRRAAAGARYARGSPAG